MRVLVTGGSGQLGVYLLESLLARHYDVVAWSGRERGSRLGCPLHPVNLEDPAAIEAALRRDRPDAIIHCAAVSHPGAVRAQPETAWRVNVEATRRIAHWSAREGLRLIFTSTDLVFDGTNAPYKEEAIPCPTTAYGRTKLEGERCVAAVPFALTVRLALQFGPSRIDRPGFFDEVLVSLQRGESRCLFEDEFRTPLDFHSTAEVLAEVLAEDACMGILHVGGLERVSRLQLFQRIARSIDCDPSRLYGERMSDKPNAEPRPSDCSLDTTHLKRFACDRRQLMELAARQWVRQGWILSPSSTGFRSSQDGA